MPERSNGKLYNTCCVFDNTGTLLAKHRWVVQWAGGSVQCNPLITLTGRPT